MPSRRKKTPSAFLMHTGFPNKKGSPFFLTRRTKKTFHTTSHMNLSEYGLPKRAAAGRPSPKMHWGAYVKKAVLALALTGGIVLGGRFQVIWPQPEEQLADHFKQAFSAAQLGCGEREKSFVEEFNVLALGVSPQEAPGPTVPPANGITEAAVSPSPTPKPVEETKIDYSNSGGFLTWNGVQVKNHTSKTVDLLSYMKNYKMIKKDKKEPQILILHTHATEAYAECETSRSQDIEKNMVRVGDELEKCLKEKGFQVLHDPKLHDYPNYNGSYKNSLATAEWYMQQYPSIDIILDVHRDAIEKEDGTKMKIATDVDKKKAAQMMFVVGTNEGGLKHDNWPENLKFAVSLQQVANKLYPGLMRPVDLRVERFNQHVTKQYIIVEVGSHGNELSEAVYSAQLLATIMDQTIK